MYSLFKDIETYALAYVYVCNQLLINTIYQVVNTSLLSAPAKIYKAG